MKLIIGEVSSLSSVLDMDMQFFVFFFSSEKDPWKEFVLLTATLGTEHSHSPSVRLCKYSTAEDKEFVYVQLQEGFKYLKGNER